MKNTLPSIKPLLSIYLLILISGCSSNLYTVDQSENNGYLENPPQSKPIYICEDISRFIDKQVGNGQCVALLKACANTPYTNQWKRGESVWGNAIPTGTAIATFKHSNYPNKRGYHAAIYVSQDEKGIYVWDQWRGKNVHLRLIRFDRSRKKPGNDAARYSVITR